MTAQQKQRRVFIDMDGVIVDFDAYKTARGLTGEEVKRKPGAYLEMPAIAGAIEAVRSVIGMGFEVWIATKPPTGVPYAYSDKAAWVMEHLPELKRRIIVTHDKGLLGDSQDFLCDDRPHKANCERFTGTLLRFVDGYHWPQALADLRTARSPQPPKTYNFDQILDELGPERRAKVEKRFEELLADYNAQEPVSSSQPAKPADAVLPRYGFPRGIQTGESPQPMSDGYWTPWHVADLVIAGLSKELDAREAAAPPALRAKLRSCEDALAAAEAREAAAGGVSAGYVIVPRALPIEAEIAFCEAWFARTRVIDDPGMQDAWSAALGAIPPQPIAQGEFDLFAHLIRQREWSERTFGPGNRTAGVIDHIRKELIEVESSPDDVTEWIDIVILALDGAWRAGHDAATIIAALQSKQAKNESRTWPDWRNADPSKAIEHDRSGEPAAMAVQGGA